MTTNIDSQRLQAQAIIDTTKFERPSNNFQRPSICGAYEFGAILVIVAGVIRSLVAQSGSVIIGAIVLAISLEAMSKVIEAVSKTAYHAEAMQDMLVTILFYLKQSQAPAEDQAPTEFK